MIRKWIKRAGERIEDRLRHLCGALSPDMRVYAIVTLFVLFAALSLYSTVSAIYSLGRNDGERIRIEHLRRLAPQPEQRHKPESFGNSDAKLQQEAESGSRIGCGTCAGPSAPTCESMRSSRSSCFSPHCRCIAPFRRSTLWGATTGRGYGSNTCDGLHRSRSKGTSRNPSEIQMQSCSRKQPFPLKQNEHSPGRTAPND